ncbi:hypothetical protein CYMTET_22431 [Cymbomonas tetramitiformis]|uniref:Uncharacterized protein n=1 Tax=Cymbomonas tetramitiformis TaxID=36881 RepID=A0AAE0G0K4_9CHLO|nr:hypothetical protein CYMTET_22431 [Cymbomonas tetramitiformis]
MAGTFRGREHNARVEELYYTVGPPVQRKKTLGALSGEQGSLQRLRKLKQLWRKAYSKVKRNLRRVLKGHPLFAIYMVTAIEPFTRSERILIQTNTFLLMLVFTVWFYYIKSVNCCRDIRNWVACPDSSDVNQPCLGFDFCSALANNVDAMPEELSSLAFECTAFPQSSFIGRALVITIIIGILTPTTMILSQLFVIAASIKIPGHWGHQITPEVRYGIGDKMTAVVQSGVVIVYAMLFNFQKFNKALAVTLVNAIAMFFRNEHVKAAMLACLYGFIAAYQLVRDGCRVLVRKIMGRDINRPLTKEELLKERVRLASPVEKAMQKVAYFCIVFGWFMIAWSLFTYSMLIREMMGKDAEAEVVKMWAVTLVTELFGLQTFAIIFLRLGTDAVLNTIKRKFSGSSPAMRWFETFIIIYASSDSRGADETGDQDMGDDADADGGDFGGDQGGEMGL